MALELNGTTGVSLVQDGVITDANLPAGSVLQVISVSKTDTWSTSSTTFADVTGLSVSITPQSSSNKILVIANVSVGPNSGAASLSMRLVRDSTNILLGDAASNRPRVTTNGYSGDSAGAAPMIPSGMSYLDSPATTSSTTYKIQAASSTSSTVYINRTVRDADTTGYDARSASTLTVMEIKV